MAKKLLEDYGDNRGRGFIFDNLSTGRGHGPFTEHQDGSVKFDLINGIGINLLGHSHPVYIKSCLEAATYDTLMCGNLQPYGPSKELTKSITDAVDDSRLKHFWFAGSGSFANDLALKLLWQKQSPKYGLIAFNNAFAGRSVATQDITTNPAYREGMPRNLNVSYAPHYDQNNPDGALQNTLDALDKIWNENPDSFCAIMMEIIQGEGGFVFGTKEYYQGVFDWAKSKGIYIWIDEVQSFGRTHELFAFQTFGLQEYVDIVTIAKTLQVGGLLYTEELNPKPGLIAGTFNGSIPSIIAGSKVVKFLTEGNFYGQNGRIKQIEETFIGKLQDLMAGSCKGKIKYAGGIGTMIAFEVGNSDKEDTWKFIRKLFENGIVAFSAGRGPVRVRFLLPISLKDEHIDEIFQILEKTVHEVF